MKITLRDLQKIIANDAQRRKLKRLVRALLVERSALKQQILELLAGDAAALAKATALYEKSESYETRTKAGLPTQ